MKSFFVELITPERSFFKGDVEMLVIDTPSGEMGVLAGHVPTVTALKPGAVRILQKGEWREAFNSGGFMEIRPDETILLSQALEWPDEIEEKRVRAAIERAEERLRKVKSQREYTLNKAALARAFARLRVRSHYRED